MFGIKEVDLGNQDKTLQSQRKKTKPYSLYKQTANPMCLDHHVMLKLMAPWIKDLPKMKKEGKHGNPGNYMQSILLVLISQYGNSVITFVHLLCPWESDVLVNSFKLKHTQKKRSPMGKNRSEVEGEEGRKGNCAKWWKGEPERPKGFCNYGNLAKLEHLQAEGQARGDGGKGQMQRAPSLTHAERKRGPVSPSDSMTPSTNQWPFWGFHFPVFKRNVIPN